MTEYKTVDIALAAFAMLATSVLSGCDDPNLVPVYPATGTLTMDGEPFGPTLIHLRPMAKDGRMLVGQVDEHGKITFTTFEHGDGGPAGRYRVLVAMKLGAPPRPFPAIYRNEQKSPLVVTVAESEENVLNIEMDSKAGPMVSARSSRIREQMNAAQKSLMTPNEENE